ncbi:MAG: DUF4040 domain-containing protein [Deltaproteobacteria bacterium]|nr:DUF4040 domain-containing protein [Deltaproteobacteria bacterium]
MNHHQLISLAIFLPFVVAPILFFSSRLHHRAAYPALLVALLSLLSVFQLYQHAPSEPLVFATPWIPDLQLNFSFLIDGLSLFYGFVVSGMGLLVILYARFYLGETYGFQSRFYAYLLFFMGAMLGTVFSNNAMLLFVFWELTGIASFFLIGFSHNKENSRIGARMALITTGIGGLAMLMGIIVLSHQTGTSSLSALIQEASKGSLQGAWVHAVIILLLLGAFSKSAQFPFHYWLPNAMAAPTPVSAYLHSATMVKLGLFLVARFHPILSDTSLWFFILVSIGFFTMLLGSVFAFLSHDLKAVLAYSTVSQLGFIMGHYGLQSKGLVGFDFFHVSNHVFYKGLLFMVAGIIDHAAGTRDLRQLGGLKKQMPLTSIICAIGLLGMTAFPGTTGFISKELMLEHLVHGLGSTHSAFYTYALICVGLSASFMVAFSLRIFCNTFLGAEKNFEHFHKPSFLFNLSPLVLSVPLVVFGFFPQSFQNILTTLHVNLMHQTTLPALAVFHGFTWPLGISIMAFALGFVLYKLAQGNAWQFARIPNILRFDHFFNFKHDAVITNAKKITHVLRSDTPKDYLFVITGFVSLCLILLLCQSSVWSSFVHSDFSLFIEQPLGLLALILVGLGVFGTLKSRNMIYKLISLSIAGFLITFFFVLYKAPDLALTQILIEVVSLVLVLLLFTKLPTSEMIDSKKFEWGLRKIIQISLSVLVGVVVFFLVLLGVNFATPDKMGSYFTDNTLALAEGANAVNTVLVDFRGYDTMGEISVLVIAMIGILALLMSKQEVKE